MIDVPIYFYRDRDGREIDLVIETANTLFPVEIKMSASPALSMAKHFSALDDIPEKSRGTGVILCRYDRRISLADDVISLPIEYI